MQRVMAKCSERCGWTGAVRTGWLACSPKWAATMPPDRIRERGPHVEFRRRLRDTACPSCGVVGLDRCERLDPKTLLSDGRLEPQ